MKKITLIISCLMLSYFSMAQVAWPGPDDCGYYGRTDADTVDATYNWIDITAVGTEVTGLGDDNTVGPFDIGFNFNYYWSTVSKFYICSNGYISFANHTISSGQDGFYPFPNADAKDNTIAAMLCDLKADGATNPTKIYYYTTPDADSLIVTYDQIGFWDNNASNGEEWSGSNTFQIILDKTNKTVIIQYKDQQGSWNTSYDGTTYPCVVGMENSTGTKGLMYTADVLPLANTVVKFYPPAGGLQCSVIDVQPVTVNGNDRNGGFFTYKSVGTSRSAHIENSGNTDILTSFSLSSKLKRGAQTINSQTNNQTVTLGANVDTLKVGEEIIVNFTPVTATTRGYYTVETTTSLSSDVVTGNNLLKTELVVLDSTGLTIDTMRFFNPQSIADGVVGSFGLPEAGVSFRPPFYPFTITGLRFHTSAQDCAQPATIDIHMSIFDDDGPNFTPGSLLKKTEILQGDVFVCDYTQIDYDTAVGISDGSFYVLFQPIESTGTQNVFLTTDEALPASNRTYEVNNGAWGIYRSVEKEDFFIDVLYANPHRYTPPVVFGNTTVVKSNFSVSQNYPNPAKDITAVTINLDKNADVQFSVSNLIGQAVYTNSFTNVKAGTHQLNIDTANLENGIYFYTVKANGETVTKKMVVSK